jgi:hypothetical protein
MIDCRRLTLPHRCLAPRAGMMIHPLHELVHCGLTEVWLVDELSVAPDEPGNVFLLYNNGELACNDPPVSEIYR